jgi:hypothetical protein
MKKQWAVWFRLCVVTLMGLFIFLPAASAHTMTVAELALGDIAPGMTMGEVITAKGEPAKVDRLEGEGVRMYTYYYGPAAKPDLVVSALAYKDDQRPKNALPVRAYKLQTNAVASPSGITVGTDYQQVVDKFGEGEMSKGYKGLTNYVYKLASPTWNITYSVGQGNIITSLYVSLRTF